MITKPAKPVKPAKVKRGSEAANIERHLPFYSNSINAALARYIPAPPPLQLDHTYNCADWCAPRVHTLPFKLKDASLAFMSYRRSRGRCNSNCGYACAGLDSYMLETTLS
jgi:hypothetical protein